jgi:hypothetical protein
MHTLPLWAKNFDGLPTKEKAMQARKASWAKGETSLHA